MDRRHFLANVGVAATWAAISVTLTSCGDDKKNPTNPQDQCADNGAVSVSAGHSHEVCVTQAQETAGNAVTLTLTGSGHTHSLSLTSEQVVAIAVGTTVVANSSNDNGHTHTVTFNQ